jgi:N-methylhydantoinase B
MPTAISSSDSTAERDVTIDPITFEVMANALSSTADEMAITIMRSAYSPVVRDSMDYSTALCDHLGRVVAQGLTLAVQLGAFPDAMRHLIDQFGDDMAPGDVFVFNDPYGAGGQHLPDIYVIKPIFVGERLEGYAATMAHHCDVGGLTPGSTAMHATEIFQEGLRLPIVKLYERNQPCSAVFRIIERNTRQPVQVAGDLKAQVAACTAGERGFAELFRRHAPDVVRFYLEELLARAEKLMRAEIAALPDGEYICEDYIDGLGDDPKPLVIRVRLIIAGDEITVDLAGTSAQVPAAINCPIAMSNSAVYCAIRSIAAADIPNCDGYMRPIRVSAPSGTIVNPVLPGACAARGVIGYRVFDAIMGALAQIVPDRVIAAGEGGPTLVSIGGRDQGRAFVLTEVMVGNWGARATRDGPEGISNPAANLSNQPIELIEAELPLEIVEYGFRQDSGGPGKFRGGLAFVREWRLLADEAVFTVRSDRRVHPPYGIAAGRPGGPSHNTIRSGDRRTTLPPMPMAGLHLGRLDSFHHVSAGGGGYGNPLARDPLLVLEDALDEKVSVEAARRDYGVAIDIAEGTIDASETARLRSSDRTGAGNQCEDSRCSSTT